MMKTSTDDPGMPGAQLEREARVWLRLLSSAEVKPWDAEGFKRWLGTSAAHREAFNQVKQRWSAMRPLAGEFLRAHPAEAVRHRAAMAGRPRRDRRAFLGAALSTAAVAGVAIFHPPARLWPAPAEWGADYRTGTGELRAITLASQVSVTLNTQTSIRRQQSTGLQQGGVDLLSGEAAFDLPAGSGLFSVVAGAGRAIAAAGSFEVRYLQGRACVTCLDGAVRVEHPAGTRTLRAREQLIYDASLLSGVSNVEPAKVSAWRHGELVFDNRRLAEVIAEINRYRAGRVVLMNDSVRDSAVSGRFRVASLDSALTQLQHTFDLDARQLPGGLLVLS